jgi:hypothetical protein
MDISFHKSFEFKEHKETMTSVLKMQVPSLGHAQKCGVFKLVNGIPTSPPDYCIPHGNTNINKQ